MEAQPRGDLLFRVHYFNSDGIGDQRGAAQSEADAIALASAFFIARELAAITTELCLVVVDGTGAIVAWIGDWPTFT